MTGVQKPSNGRRKVKKKYSHNACRECKERKIKCDEAKPACWHCGRLGRTCIYNEFGQHAEMGTAIEIERERNGGSMKANKNGTDSINHDPTVKEAVNVAQDTRITEMDSNITDDSSVSGILQNIWNNGASSLASDLNEILNVRLDEVLGSSSYEDHEFLSSVQTADITLDSPKGLGDMYLQANIPLSHIPLKGRHLFYMKQFYYDFSRVVLPFSAELSDGTSYNPVRDVLLQYASYSYYLLYAVLACGSRTSQRKTLLQEDEDNYCYYLKCCLEALSREMDRNLLAQIEPILLTILLLTSDNASSRSQKWRAHLRGAKDLLVKHFDNQHSDTLYLCRTWFSSIEILAGLGSPNGGTLQTAKELDLLITTSPQEQQALRRLNLIQYGDVSLIHGYSASLIPLLKNLMKLLRASQIGGEVRYPEVLDLLSGLNGILKNCFISPTGIVPENYQKPLPPSDLTGEVCFPNGSKCTFCWIDISNRSHALAAIITVFTKILSTPKESPIVQSAVKEMLSLMVFLDDQSQTTVSPCMYLLQWPMLIAGLNCIQPQQRINIELFFCILAQLGAGSAGFVLSLIRDVWDGKGEGNGSVDIVTY